MMFHTDVFPTRMHPVMLHPQRRQTCSPCGGSFIPVHMRIPAPEMAPRCRKQRTPNEDFLSQLFAHSDSDDSASSSDSDDQEFLDFMTLFGNKRRHKKHNKKDGKEKSTKTKSSSTTKGSKTDQVKSDKKVSVNPEGQTNNDVIGSPLDMRGYDPKHINIQTSDEQRTVTVTAKRIINTLFGPLVSERKQVFPIPQGIVPRDIRSFLSPEGVLHLKVSKPSDIIEKQEDSKPKDESVPAMDTNESKPQLLSGSQNKDTPKKSVNNETTSDESQQPKATERADDETMDSDVTTGESNSVPEVEATDKSEPKVENAATETSSDSYDVVISQFDMSGFSTEDVKVDVSEKTGTIEISAKHEENTPKGLLMREYYRTIPIPDGVAAKEIRSHLSAEGVFLLQAQCTLALTE